MKLGPQSSKAIELQSWMTLFTLVFAYLGITEVYDKTELLIFKPKLYEKHYGKTEENEETDQQRHVRRRIRYDGESSEEDGSCLYDIIFCGSLRKCMYRRSPAEQDQKRARRIGTTVFIFLTLIAGTVMELSHRQIWSEWFTEYAPHYSKVTYLDEDKITELD